MASIYLAPYSFKIRKRYSKDLIIFKDAFVKPTLQRHLANYFTKLKEGFYDDQRVGSIFKATHLLNDPSSSTIHGVIESGDYGIESKFYDRKGTHKYNRLKDHAEVMPFYFLIYAPQDSSVGFLILQRFGHYGIAKSFNQYLSEHIRNLLPDHTVEIEPIVSTKVLHQIIEEGRIRKAIFTRYELPRNIEGYFNVNSNGERGYMEMSLIASKSGDLNLRERIKKILFGTAKADSLLSIENFPFDDMKVKVEYSGGTRTVSLGDRSFRASYDITEDVDIDSSGHPNFNSIRKVASSLVIELNSMTL